jgi:hypothetical protein
MRFRKTLLPLVALASITSVIGLERLATASALTTSYSSALPAQESLIVDAYETLSAVGFFSSAAERLTVGKTSDADKLEALVAWTNENVRPQYAAPDRLVVDNFYDIVRRGFGVCDQSAHVLATLAHYAGFESRLLFLRDEDGVSHHTVTQVDIGNKWIIADPWAGFLWKDSKGHLLAIDDVTQDPRLYEQFPYSSFWSLSLEDFERGTPFYTFPYQPATDTLKKVLAKIAGQPIAPPPSSVGLADLVTSGTQGGQIDAAAIVLYDRARRAHLDGDFARAVDLYRQSLRTGLDAEMTESADFFIGLALLDAHDAAGAVAAFNIAIASGSDDWERSELSYRGRALEELGNKEGALRSFEQAGTPDALAAIRRIQAR